MIAIQLNPLSMYRNGHKCLFAHPAASHIGLEPPRERPGKTATSIRNRLIPRRACQAASGVNSNESSSRPVPCNAMREKESRRNLDRKSQARDGNGSKARTEFSPLALALALAHGHAHVHVHVHAHGLHLSSVSCAARTPGVRPSQLPPTTRRRRRRRLPHSRAAPACLWRARAVP